jgi:hypothetical protein
MNQVVFSSDVAVADPLIDGSLASIPLLEFSAPVRVFGARPYKPDQNTF